MGDVGGLVVAVLPVIPEREEEDFYRKKGWAWSRKNEDIMSDVYPICYS